MKGVVYVAIGEQYVAEASRSAKSLKKYVNWPTTLFTDISRPIEGFDQVLPITIDNPDITLKARILKLSPYEQTLFLDTDTYIIADVSDMFEVLNRCDVAATHAPRRYGREGRIPHWFPEMNGGMLLFQESLAMIQFINRWIADMEAVKERVGRRINMEQPSLRRALYASTDLKLFILPPEYNMRVPIPTFVSRKVRILHGRGELLDAAIERVNERENMRLWLPVERRLYEPR